MIPVAFAYGGWQTATFVAGEMRHPARDLSRGLVLGVTGVVALYLAVNVVCVRVLGPDGLDLTATPASDVMRAAVGERGAWWIAVGIAISTLGFLSQGMLTAPRVYHAMAADGLFFHGVGRLSQRTGAPVAAIALQGVLATAIACSGKYEQILNYEVSVDFISFGLTAAALFILRRRLASSDPGNPLYLAPGHPYTTALFVLVSAAIVASTIATYPANSAVALAILLAGHSRIFVLAPPMRHKHSEYMHWAKTQSRARYNLATSGVGPFPIRELPFDFGTLEINGENKYGYAPLVNAIARKSGVDPGCVVEAEGTSMANHLAMAALIEPGDEVLIEHPAYGPLLDAARYLGADIKRFARCEDSGFRVDPAEVRRAVTPRTKLIVITNLHNPSGVWTPEAALREVGDLGPYVLVDEVYLDAVFEGAPRSSFHLGPRFVITSSLTKVYGLSGLRCGWILAQPDLAHRMRLLNDVFAATAVHPAEQLAVAAFAHLDYIRARARRVLEADRTRLYDFLARQTAVSAVATDWGTTAFLRLCDAPPDAFLERLRSEFETSAVPGRFFEMPDHFRVGMGVDSEMFAEGLRRMETALHLLDHLQ